MHTDDPSSWHKRSHGLDAIAAADKTVNNVARCLVMRNYRNNQMKYKKTDILKEFTKYKNVVFETLQCSKLFKVADNFNLAFRHPRQIQEQR